MTPAIPPRQPIEEQFSGFLVEDGTQQALAVTAENIPITAHGNFTIRYGIRYLGKPHLSIVPGLVVIDYGKMLNGDTAWDFLIKRSNLYPRAEVFGLRNDGKDDMTYVKNLDLALQVAVLVYATGQTTTPIAEVTALIADSTSTVSERLRGYLRNFETYDAWLAVTL